MIIGISGRIGSGKDTMGSMIQYLDSHSPKSYEEWIKPRIFKGQDIGDLSMYEIEENSWQIKKFAGKLKTIASLLTGINVEKFEDQAFKKTNLSSDWDIHGMPTTVREFLQKLGTDAVRNGLHDNTWVNALFADYKRKGYNPLYPDGVGDYPKWVITDTRFPNEAKVIKDKGGIVIRVVRYTEDIPEGLKASLHASETALDNWDFDEVIVNDKGLDKLLHLTEEILRKYDMIIPINHLKN